MNPRAKFAIKIVLILLAGMPVAFILTIVMSPLWSWIETSYRIESIGHSGPADWCFEVIYGIYVALTIVVLWVRHARKKESNETLYSPPRM